MENEVSKRKENEMETNEILSNNEIVEETTEQVTKAVSGKGMKMVVGFGIGVLAGMLIYRYIAKPIAATFRAKKNQMQMEEDFDDFEEAESQRYPLEEE